MFDQESLSCPLCADPLARTLHRHRTPRVPLPMKPLFKLGQTYMTPGAGALDDAFLLTCLMRHVAGDWGDLDAHDKKANKLALRAGLRLLSSYNILSGGQLWIITEADRSSTTLLLPEEY